MEFETNPTSEITVISSAILRNVKNSKKNASQTSGIEGEAKTCFISLNNGADANIRSNRAVPESSAALPFWCHSGKQPSVAAATGITDMQTESAASAKYLNFLILRHLRDLGLHIRYSFSDAVLKILRQSGRVEYLVQHIDLCAEHRAKLFSPIALALKRIEP